MDIRGVQNTTLKEAFVENFTGSNILNEIFQNDTLSRVLFSLPPLQPHVEEFKSQLHNKCEIFVENAILYQCDRQKLLDDLMLCLENIIEEKCAEGKKYIEKFLHVKMRIVDTISNLDYEDSVSRIKLDNTLEDYVHQLDCLWEVLMQLETELMSKIKHLTCRFSSIMRKQIMQFLEYCHLTVDDLQNLDKKLFEKFYEFCTKEFANTDTKTTNLQAALAQIFQNAHNINAALNESHQRHLDVFIRLEKSVTSRASAWLYHLVDRLDHKELQRNRHRVMEINRFLDLQRDSLDNLETSVAMKLLNNA